MRAMELIRNWALLVDFDIPNDHLTALAHFMSIESEKEKEELLDRMARISKAYAKKKANANFA